MTQELNEKEEIIERHSQNEEVLKMQIKELNEELSSLVDSDTYRDLKEKYIKVKKDLKKCVIKLHEAEKLNSMNEDKIDELRQMIEEKTKVNNELEEKLSEFQAEREKHVERINILQSNNSTKIREKLSLERGIKKEKDANSINSAECQIRATEN